MNNPAEDQTIRESTRAPLVASVEKQQKPCLTVLYGGPVGTVYTLAVESATLIGRAADAVVHLEDQRVSRRHATVTISSKRAIAILEDLGSSNGTFVNGVRIRRKELKEGDQIQLGQSFVLKFSYQGNPEQNVQQELAGGGIKDGLTGIHSKKYFLDRIAAEYAHAQRHDRTLALLLLDVDDFNTINDAHGHPAGDFILKELARVVSQMLRADDVFSRYEGEQFAVLARDIGDEGAVVLAQRIRRAIQSHKFVLNRTQFSITVSLGIGTLSDKVGTATELIKVTDGYLNKAKKKGGRNSIAGNAVKTFLQNNGSLTTIRYSSKKASA